MTDRFLITCSRLKRTQTFRWVLFKNIVLKIIACEHFTDKKIDKLGFLPVTSFANLEYNDKHGLTNRAKIVKE